MQQDKDISILLNNIQKGLEKLSVKDLNEALVKVLREHHTKNKTSPLVKFTLTIVCDEFKISERILLKKHSRGDLQDAKQITYCLLHFILGFTYREVATNVFNTWQSVIHNGVARLIKCNADHKADRKFLERYERLSNELLNFLNEQTKPADVGNIQTQGQA